MKKYLKKLSVLTVFIITVLSMTGCQETEDEFEVAVGKSVLETADSGNVETDTTSDYDLYQAVLDEYKENCDKDHRDISCYCSYTIYDIDSDGTEELIVQDGMFEADKMHSVYTAKNGKVVELGEYSAWHMGLYIDNNSGKLVAVVADSVEYWFIYDVTIDSDSVSIVETDKVKYTEDFPSNLSAVTFTDIDSSLTN